MKWIDVENIYADLDEELIERTKGFLEKEEGQRLYLVGLEASSIGACLEIGSYCGKSAIYLGAGCREHNGILFSIDHHQGSEEQQPGEEYFDPALFNPVTFRPDTLNAFRSTLVAANLENTVVPIVSGSDVAARQWKTPLSLVFIDGGHSDASASGDYHGWAGHIQTGGYLLIHDIFKNPAEGGQAPYRVYRQALASGRFRELPMTKTLGVLQRIS